MASKPWDDLSIVDGDEVSAESWIDHIREHRADNEVYANTAGFPGDATGGDIGPWINSNANDEKRIILPDGVYSLETRIAPATTIDTFELVGKPRATLRVDANIGRAFEIGNNSNPIPRMSIRNIDVDVTTQDCGYGMFFPSESLYNANLTTIGERDHGSGGSQEHYRCEVLDESGVAVHRNIRHPDGDSVKATPDASAAIPFRSGTTLHEGTNIWIGCYAEHFWDNGFYFIGSPGRGGQVMIGCVAKNCGRQMVRVGGGDTLINCAAILDEEIEMGMTAMLAIRDAGVLGAEGDPGKEAGWASIHGFRVIRTAAGQNGSRHTVWVRDAQFVSIRDIVIENSSNHWSLALNILGSEDDRKGMIVIEGGRIIDSGTTASAEAAVRIGRQGAVLRDLYIHAENRRTVAMESNNGDCRIENCRLEGTSFDIKVDPIDGGYLVMDGGQLFNGIHVSDNATQLDHIAVKNVDLREFTSESDVWTGEDPATQGITTVLRDNILS